jgi:PST family polysaccharide transporter
MASFRLMSTFSAALRGTSWAVGAQVVIGVGQIAYASLTARVFSPHSFGEFTAALTLQALIAVCTATGLSSFVLKEPHLDRWQVRAINLFVVALASLSAVVFWLVSPYWLAWLNSPGGDAFVPLLTCATFAAPVGAVQSALLRREGNGGADAAVYVLAFIIATGLAAASAILVRQPWTLALGTAVNPIVLTVMSRFLRRAVYPGRNKRLTFDWLVFALRVTGQNLVFFGLSQVPTWSLGANTTPAVLGQFSRGNAAAYLPAYALSTAVIRGTQPHWRKVVSDESRARAISEALVLAASVSFLCFTVLAALSHPFTNLLLGPGWELAAEFLAWLAIGLAMQVPTALLANYLETTGRLSRVHWIQFANAVGLAPGVGLLLWLHDFRYLLAGFVLSNILGLVTAVCQVSAALATHPRRLFKQLVGPLISAICCGGLAYLAATLVAVGAGGRTGLVNATQLGAGGLAVIVFVFLTRKWQPAFSILTARGVLKRS